MSDAQGNLASNPETVTHTRNGNFEQTLLSYWTIPVFPPLTNPGIEQVIAPIILAPQTVMTPAMKEVVTDAASGGTWIHRNTRQVISTGIGEITPGDNCNAIGVVELFSPVLIAIVVTSPPCGINVIQDGCK